MYIHLQYWFKVNKLAKIWHVFSFGSREEYEPSIFWILLPRPILHKTHLENTRTIFREHLQSVPTSTRRHFCPYFKDIKVWYFYWREIVFVAIISPASALAADSVSNCIKICRDFPSLPSLGLRPNFTKKKIRYFSQDILHTRWPFTLIYFSRIRWLKISF